MGKVWRSVQEEGDARREAARPGDARLIDGLRRGEPQALAGLHAEYAAGIYSLALRVLRHASDAEDITQDVLIRAFERLPRDREVLLRPWLYRLTLNCCYDHLRGAARRPLAAPPEREAPAPHDPYDQSELQRLLEDSLADLTRRQRAALLLKDVHGLTLVEVAACLDLTPGSVEVLLARARRSFRASYLRRCAAAGRPVPRSAGAFVALPLLPLPAALGALAPALPGAAPPFAAPPVPGPATFLPALPVAGVPISAATGGGIGALLGLPSSVKTAVLVAAAAASLGSAELVATRAGGPPPRPVPSAAAVTVSGAVTTTAVSPGVAAVAHKSVTARRSATPPPSQSTPSPTASATAEPSPQGSPLAIPTPAITPEGSPPASPSPDPRATSTPAATPTATPSADPSPSPSPEASLSPSSSPAP